MQDVIIFGAGRYGFCAQYYFKGQCNFIGFIDNDKELWGKEINGLNVYSPDILLKKKYHVLIANSQHANEIKKQLFHQYGITSAMVFRVSCDGEELDGEELVPESCDDLIVKFQGNLGNQMFQYVIYKIFEKQNKSVYADLSSFANVMQALGGEEIVFTLTEVFPEVRIKRAAPSAKRYFIENKNRKDATGLRYAYKESMRENVFDDSWILNMQKGYLDGFFQTFKYPEMVRNDLREEFSFQKKNKKLDELINKLESKDSISIHIRRAGYLTPGAKKTYGEWCNEDYYLRAMNYIRERIKSPTFCFFSDDIPWVKVHWKTDNAIYVGREKSDTYGDWYDMCLMSHCKHNIIANSSFSWWGAWLNRNPDKIVIAPKKWVRKDLMHDICPPEWIRM